MRKVHKEVFIFADSTYGALCVPDKDSFIIWMNNWELAENSQRVTCKRCLKIMRRK